MERSPANRLVDGRSERAFMVQWRVILSFAKAKDPLFCILTLQTRRAKTCFAGFILILVHNKKRIHTPLSESSSMTYAPSTLPENSPALQNPAVAYCCQVWDSTCRQALQQGRNLVFARVEAHKAYQKSLPPLTGDENIRNFIACVAHGILIGAILSRDGARLIAAARAAQSANRNSVKQSKTSGESCSSASKIDQNLNPM